MNFIPKIKELTAEELFALYKKEYESEYDREHDPAILYRVHETLPYTIRIQHASGFERTFNVFENGQPEDALIEAIRDVLMAADAIDCDADFDKQVLYSGNTLYHVPDGYNIRIDFNKLAVAIFEAGYRKE